MKERNDDQLGMAWWNGLAERDRAKWAAIAGTGRAVDAWNAFKSAQMERAGEPIRGNERA